MKILIDADGCPVVDICVRQARTHGLECIIFCDTSHEFERQGAQTITVSKGADSVDFALTNRVAPSDIVVTQDYGLAAMCLAKRAKVIRQDGLIFTNENIDALLMSRHEAKKIMRSGGRVKGAKKRTKEDDEVFYKKLLSLIEAGESAM